MQKIILILTFLFSAVLANAQSLFINEIMASNNNTLADEFGEFDDWVEIYNPNTFDIDIGGGYFSDDLADLTDWQIPVGFPEDTTIPAGGYKIFWADNDTLQGANHLGFTLSGSGEQIVLIQSNGEIIVDAFQFWSQENDISYGRVSDGDPSFQYFNISTPNATNVDVQPEPMDIHINEIQAENFSTHFDGALEYDPWIELYNPNTIQVNLAGYTLIYNDGEAEYTFPADNPNATVIESNDFKLIWCDGQDLQGPKHTNFTLASSGNLELVANDNSTSVENRSYISPGTDMSVGSEMDGVNTFIDFNIPTPDVTNQITIIQPDPLFINEIMASNMSDTLDSFGESEDWLEIYNPNNYPVDLSGYHLSDNYGGDTYEIPSTYPDSVTVPPNGFLLFWADDDDEQGVRHTNFKFSSSGDDALILSPDSFTIADFKAFPIQDTDISYGRQLDGEPTWIYFTPEFTTPEYSNDGVESVEENSAVNLSFYPNPAADQVKFTAEVNTVEIYNALGELVEQNSHCNAIDVMHLKSGVYTMILNKNKASKLIID